MNENIKRLARQATEHCIGEHSDDDETTGPIPWVWEFKYAELIIRECLDLMPVGPERQKIMDHFGLDSPEDRNAKFIDEMLRELAKRKFTLRDMQRITPISGGWL